MRLLVILDHPVPESFSSALARTVVESARARGHEVRLIDLHAEGFNPVMSADERRCYHDPGAVPTDVQPHVQALLWAEGLVFVYPTWWSAQPAMLKGWIDRVWRPGVAFTVPPGSAQLRPALTHVRLIGVVTTFGAPWWVWTFLLGAPGRRIILRGLRLCTGRQARTFWLGLHEMDSQDADARARFLDRVRARIARIPL